MNPFDFNDVSDLSPELQAKLTTGGSTEYTKILQVLEAAKAAGRTSVTLTEIIAAASRMNVELPSEVTVRNWLNKCVAQGMATKPTRQSYAISEGTEAPVQEDAPEPTQEATQEPTETVQDADPLAGIEGL